MFKNNLKIAWRNLLNDRQFAFLNLTGLATGLACTFLIYLWVSDELNVDQFHRNGGRLYEVMQNIPLADGSPLTIDNTPDPLARALAEQMPEVKETVVVKAPDADGSLTGIISANGNTSVKGSELYVTQNFLNIFSFPLIRGNKQQLFTNTRSVLLSSATAIKLFHTTQNIIGKTITWDRGTGHMGKLNGPYVISGIFETPPSNSSMQFDLLFENAIYQNIQRDQGWLSSNQTTYLLLKPGADAQKLNGKLKNFITSKYKPGTDEYKWAGTLFIQRYTEKYLHNHYENGAPAGGRIEYVKLFSIIAIFILVIACINFMNLSTAKASRRMKEVGIKKVIGASRVTLIVQYIGESLLMSFFALVLAIVLVLLLLPAFREITGKPLALSINGNVIATILGITLITGIISGSYPALFLSGFKPIAVLKGKLGTSAAETFIRKGLVVFQFAISIILIISVMVVYQQMKLIQNKNLGYNKDHVIHFTNDGKLQQNEKALIADIKNLPGVVNASNMEGDMLGNHSGGGGIDWPGKTHRIEFSGLYADYDFMETMGLKTVEGRALSRNYAGDTASVLFNETAIREMGLKKPVGKIVKLWGRPMQVVGVLKDFHYESLYKNVGPFFLSYTKNASNIMVRIRAGAEQETIKRLAALYAGYNPGLPFEYRFLDEDYQALYSSEQRLAVLSRYFAGIAILISCLGLFGLAAFTAQKRQKEISIRKVVGATVNNMVFLLSKDFIRLVLIATIIAFPIAWLAMHRWLNTFAYRYNITPIVFIITFIAMMGIALLTVSYQAIKAALTNPVKSLRSE